jgi:hypothetical protein
MSEADDDLAVLRANVDQSVAAAGEVGRSIAAYFSSLVDAGLTREEALTLTRDWQQFNFEGASVDDE